MSLREKVTELAKKMGADIVGFAPADRFDKDDEIFKIMPETKTVIGLGFRILRGIYRGVEEGSTYYQYTTMGVENMEETIMPSALLRVSQLVEEEGYFALPQLKNPLIMAENDGINPEVHYTDTYHGKRAEHGMNFLDAAVKCGLGEAGLHGALLTDEFGPMVRYCFILTDAEFEATQIVKPHLCDKCGECIKGCPGKAINDKGERDEWRCAVYYSGACGLKNPFMPPDAYADFEDRIAIIAGEAEISPEKAKKIIANTYFYPPSHQYPSSICGRTCDVACYVHLEEKGVLTRKFKRKFREREPWKFDIKDFE